MYDELIHEIDEYNKSHNNEKRQIHINGVCETSIELAKIYGVSQEKAYLASLFHDMFKWLKGESLNNAINNLNIDSKYLDKPNLAHSKIAAKVMERDYGINDRDLINAVSFHTTGRANMSTLEKIIYLADAIEPSRDYPSVNRLRELSKVNLDEACYQSLNSTLNYLKLQGNEIDNDTFNAVEYFKKERGKNED